MNGSFSNKALAAHNKIMVTKTVSNPRKECSCGVNLPLEPFGSCHSYLGVMTPRFALGGDILQASLTIAPTARSGLRERTLSRHSVATITEKNNWSENVPNKAIDWKEDEEPKITEVFNPTNIPVAGTLPTRHSKSLDQLEMSMHANGVLNSSSLPRQASISGYNPSKQSNHIKHHTNSITHYKKPNLKPEELLKNINEFREKYKNPGEPSNKAFHFHNLVPNGIDGHMSIKTPQNTPNNNYGTLTRVSVQNRSKHNDFVHEIKNKSQDNSRYYNSLPKGAGLSLPPRNSYPPIRMKKTTLTGGNNTIASIPRSNSSHALRQNNFASSTLPMRSLEIARVRISDVKKMLKLPNGHIQNHRSSSGNISSSSTDSQEERRSPKARKHQRRLLSSTSVPFKLELLEHDSSVGFSESLPNLAPPPPEFMSSPTPLKKRNSSESTSSLSDQSGWVSSRSTRPSSPETLRDDKILNGEQLRQKLQKLVDEQRLNKIGKANTLNGHNGKMKPDPIPPGYHKKTSSVTVK